MEEKTYTQAQVDDITNKVRETKDKEMNLKLSVLEEKLSAQEAFKAKYDALQQQVYVLKKKQDVNVFLSNDGDPAMFDDFYEKYGKNIDALDWTEMRTTKPGYFRQQNQTIDPFNMWDNGDGIEPGSTNRLIKTDSNTFKEFWNK